MDCICFLKELINMGAGSVANRMIFILVVLSNETWTALKAGLLVGIGFQGLCLAVSLLTTRIQPIIKYYQKLGSDLQRRFRICSSRRSSWTVPFAPIALPLIVIANFILIFVFKRKV